MAKPFGKSSDISLNSYYVWKEFNPPGALKTQLFFIITIQN
jgi:hypothetical protein